MAAQSLRCSVCCNKYESEIPCRENSSSRESLHRKAIKIIETPKSLQKRNDDDEIVEVKKERTAKKEKREKQTDEEKELRKEKKLIKKRVRKLQKLQKTLRLDILSVDSGS